MNALTGRFTSCIIILNKTAAEPANSDKQEGSITLAATYAGLTVPEAIFAYQPNQLSTVGYLDLTNVTIIPANAVVTGITVTGDSVGSFASAQKVVFDENGTGFYVHQFTGKTDGHNNKPVRQRWSIQFWTSAIWQGPAILRPIINIHYVY